MAGDRPYYPDSANEVTKEYVHRELIRISDALTNEQFLDATYLAFSDSPYTVLNRDKVILGEASGGPIVVNLPAGREGRMLYIKNISSSGSNNVVVSPNGSDDIDRNGTVWPLASSPLESIHIIYSEDEANWFIL